MMCPARQQRGKSFDRLRADVAERLSRRRAEIEEAILARVHAVSTASAAEDAEYREGLRAAVAAAVDYGLLALERGDERCGPVPAALLAQARHAARNRVGLQVVLRRYAAGYSTLGDFLMQEAQRSEEHLSALYRLQRELTGLFDRLIAAASAEYEAEASRAVPSQRLAERVKRLLAGELLDTSALDYDFDAWHVGVIAVGAATAQPLRELAAALDRRLLIAGDQERALSAWLGGRHRLDPAALAAPASSALGSDVSLALGEPAQGLRGWRLTYRQAQAAQMVASRRPRAFTRYADIALLTSPLKDDVLAGFLTDTYLAPLAAERDGGKTMRRTLSVYFATARNVSSTAAALGVSRQTVTNRIQAIEERLGRAVDTCGGEIEMAIQLAEVRGS